MVKYIEKIEGATSVKTLGIIERPTAILPGLADFGYRLVFSVFDYGTIVPPVPLDNSTVCLMQGLNFEILREHGIGSHYEGLVTNEGELVSAREAIARKIAPTITRVLFVNRLLPTHHDGKWDYSAFHNPKVNNYVHPIEFISRNELPDSASVWKRVERGELTLDDLGLPDGFKKGDPVPDNLKPILDYSTKFEKSEGDRYLSPKQAQEILGISNERFAEINKITRASSNLMTQYAASRGFNRLDGKVEYIVYDIGIDLNRVPNDQLGDSVCTWHEDRILTAQGIGISKQRIRDKVKKLNPSWYGEIERAKAQAKAEGHADFRKLMDSSIDYVSPDSEFFHAINNLFRTGTNQWVDALVYDVYPRQGNTLTGDLEKAVEEFQRVA